MANSKTLPHLCWICGKDVPLEKSNTDDHGNAVHEQCYIITMLLPQGEAPSVGARNVEFLSGWKDIANYLRIEYYRSHRVRADFLRIDSEIALTFSGIALAAADAEKKTRTTQFARRAYDAIKRLRQDVDLSDVERNKLDVNVARLKSELQSLGETFGGAA